MADPSKDYYEQRLAAHAHQAWAAAAAYHNPAAQHYMQRIQQFFPPSSTQVGPPNPYGPGSHHGSPVPQNIKDQVYSSSPQLNNSGAVSASAGSYPPGHPMHFPGIDFHAHRASPTPAHSGSGNGAPLPAHRSSPSLSKDQTSAGMNGPQQPIVPVANNGGPLPAHMRSNPYQPTTNYHNLNSSYNTPSPLMHHPSYLPPTGTTPPATSTHYSTIPQQPFTSNGSATSSVNTASSEASKFPPPRDISSLPQNDPRSILPNGGVHLGVVSSQGQYQNNHQNQRLSDGQNYNNNYNSARPEDFSNSRLGVNSRLNNEKDNISVTATSNSSHPTTSYSPYISHYGNIPPVPTTPSSTSLPRQQEQQQQAQHYGDPYTLIGGSYGSQRYSNKVEPPTQPAMQQQHHSSQNIVQPRGPTIDASNKYGGLSSPTVNQQKSNANLTSLQPISQPQNQDERRHHHSSGNSSGGTSHEEQARNSAAYGNRSNEYLLNHQGMAQAQHFEQHQGNNISTINKAMPVTGHPYLPQNVPLPPPDIGSSPQPHPYLGQRDSNKDLPHSIASQLPRPVQRGVYEPYTQSQEQPYSHHQSAQSVQQPQETNYAKNPSDLTNLNNLTNKVPDHAPDHTAMPHMKEKGQSGAWKRKHSADSKKTNERKQNKKARLSLEGQKMNTISNEHDPYAFDDDIDKGSLSSGSNSNSAVEYARFSLNGRQSSSAGPVYKFKSALLSREQQSQSSTPELSHTSSPYHSVAASDSTAPQSGSRRASEQFENSFAAGSSNANHHVALNSKQVPLRFDASDTYFNTSCDHFLNDLLNKPICISRRPSIENWKSAMAARAEKKADKRKAKELRKGLAAEKAAALEKALAEKGSVFSAKIKGAAELREAEKRLDSNPYAHSKTDDHSAAMRRYDDKKSQHVTFSSVPPIQYPPPVTPGTNMGYSSPSTNSQYAISSVSNLSAMQTPAFQPQPQYQSSDSHSVTQNSSVPPATCSTSLTSGSTATVSSRMMSPASSSHQALQSPVTTLHSQGPTTSQLPGDKRPMGKSRLPSTVPQHSKTMKVNEEQKENCPKKLQGTKTPPKLESGRGKSEKKSLPPPPASTSLKTTATAKSPEKKTKEQPLKANDTSRTLQANANANSLRSPNDVRNNLPRDSDMSDKPKVKKGTLWAMPIVPKLPQKPNEKRKPQSTIATPVISNSMTAKKKLDNLTPSGRCSSAGKQNTSKLPSKGGSIDAGENGAGLADVWRTAFGAVKPKRPVEVSPLKNKLLMKQEIEAEKCKKISYLDIPPEVRRRPKPNFGGLIHFPPDWERAVKKYHHGQCRLPTSLVTGMIKYIILLWCYLIKKIGAHPCNP